MPKHLRPRHPFLLLLLTVGLAAASVLSGVAQGELQLGNQTYSRASAPGLRMPVTRTTRFFASVGGVAFSAVAQGQVGEVVTAMRYDPTAADGRRLVVTIRFKDGSIQTARGTIYDWQLVPLAKYALDENGSAMTLFGRLENQQLQDKTVASGGRVINYHPALQDSLLGLRLLHADILIIQPNAADLFKSGGRTILGAGERPHDLAANQERFRAIAEWQDSQARIGNQFQSYVVGDLDQRVTFTVGKGEITFTGIPYWNAWRWKYRSQADANKRVGLEAQYNQRIDTYNALIRLMNASGSPSQTQEKQRLALNVQIEQIEQQLNELNTVEQMPEYSLALSRRIRELDGINPVVYQAVTTTMHYRALFKHYQNQSGPGFAAFVKSLAAVPVRPPLETPTIQRPPA